jgi:hypothetical protein
MIQKLLLALSSKYNPSRNSFQSSADTAFLASFDSIPWLYKKCK